MKERFRVFGLSVLFILLQGCGAGSESDDESVDSSLPIGSIEGKLSKYIGGEINSHRVKVIGNNTYTIELFNVTSNIATEIGAGCNGFPYAGLVLLVEDANNTEIAKVCKPEGSGGVHNILEFDVLNSGIYVVKVFSNLSSSTKSGEYSIRVLPEHDQTQAVWDVKQEPNNRAVNAYGLELGAGNSVSSDISRKNIGTANADVDWFHFEAQEDSKYVIEMFNVASNIASEIGASCNGFPNAGFALLVEDTNGTEIKEVCKPSGSGNVHNILEFQADITGTHYIKIFSNLVSSSEAGEYSIRVLPIYDHEQSVWDENQEPNNRAINAFALELGLNEAITSNIERKNNSAVNSDVDWFRFNVDQDSTYELEIFNVATNIASSLGSTCDGFPRAGLAILLEDSNGQQIEKICNPQGSGIIHNSVEFLANETDVYFVKVFPTNTISSESGEYSISITEK